MTYVLYAMPGSLYSAKARAYLRKQGIAFVERAPGDARFAGGVVPKIGRWIIPVLETTSGALIQDGTDIIDYLEREARPRASAVPTTPVQRAIAHLFEFFGGEGLLRPAMHYRWNFDEANLEFLVNDFSGALVLGGSAQARADVFAQASRRMRAAMGIFGVAPETIPDIERSYEEFLSLFDAHLERTPYLQGGRATIGDYGLIGPLFAHLGRDPYPSQLMKRKAWRVWRWVERMNAPHDDAAEYGEANGAIATDDAVPETMKALMKYIARDYLGEVEAFVGFIDQWLKGQGALKDGDIVGGNPATRVIGLTKFNWRGHEMNVGVFPFRLYMLQRLQDAVGAMSAGDRARVTGLFEEVGLSRLLTLKAARRVERRNNAEVWGAAI